MQSWPAIRAAAVRRDRAPSDNNTMVGHRMKSACEVAAELRQAWSEASGFLLSIELWLMLLVAASTVAGFWLTFMGDLRCVPAFGFALGYPAARVALHLKRRLAWPFF